ncbi:serine hydrolase [Nonomuraea rubra]|uniref:serine hydrolase n=1 Tax=Nonomuraea rubra TaxID=46180 RepID=UPI00360E3616
MSRMDVHGTVADGFEQVREAFAAVLAEQDGQAGAQLTAYAHGRRVVDLWAGDEVGGDTLTAVYSSTKGAATLVTALLVQEGCSPSTSRWPGTGRSSPPPARTRSRCGTC